MENNLDLRTLAFPFVLAAGNILTAPLRFNDEGIAALTGLEGSFSLGFAVAVTVMPRVASIFATAEASDFFACSAGLGGGLRTDSVIESDRCIMLPSDESDLPPCNNKEILYYVLCAWCSLYV